ncbi:SDR family oxidoreductase [Kozakia baliensis]|uniref:SDR family oxidoreductase n=1 Tax=Kozakia baliensis TaxID=153496 RepID=UPI0009DE14E7
MKGAVEQGANGIRANAIYPAVTRTSMTEDIFKNENYVKTLTSAFPLGRYDKAEDMAAAILFLASDDASFIRAYHACRWRAVGLERAATFPEMIRPRFRPEKRHASSGVKTLGR